ncbi:MAG TPA: BamA/TamA family outer membrane protein, partial [Steroidobacteraceae bacterium]|nr:BamA/TamA family outer membrane protein [Steroidobacteraceae bacterium]
PPGPVTVPPPAATPGWTKWFNPATAPFIPVPEIAQDPDSGLTLGLIPTWVTTDENRNVTRIVAPDLIYNPNFGIGMHARIYEYASRDEQWSIVAGIKQRVERELDAEYQVGRLRDDRWSINYSLVYDRDGTTRFYGVGNRTRSSAQTNYIDAQEYGQVQVGLNFNHTWQLLYSMRLRRVDVLRGTLDDVPSIETRFPGLLGTDHEIVNRLSLVYDTRDDLTVPSRGMKWVLYMGASANNGLLNDSSYSEAGIDGRGFWPIAPDTVLAAHMSLRYLPTVNDIPFWALSSIGGGQSVIGGEQPLRGFGQGRFYDRDSFSSTIELRHKVVSFDAVTTLLDIEVAPFADFGRVFSGSGTNPLGHVHQVYGVGFRGIARPFVVGYVDIGYGSEGAAVFTGLNYPF